MAKTFQLDAAGDLTQTVITGTDAVVQRLKTRMRTAWGEWFLNRKFGVDYFGSVLHETEPHVRIAAFRSALNDDPDITSITSLDVTDENEGVLRVSFSVTTVFGPAAGTFEQETA